MTLIGLNAITKKLHLKNIIIKIISDKNIKP